MEIGIAICAAASVLRERGPSSLPGSARRTDARTNTFYTASKQTVQRYQGQLWQGEWLRD